MYDMFNAKGATNAASLKDALNTIVRYASILEENQPSNIGLAGRPSLNDTQRDELIARALLTQEGKIALAQAMPNPIRRNLDYQGIARRLLIIDPLTKAVDLKFSHMLETLKVCIAYEQINRNFYLQAA